MRQIGTIENDAHAERFSDYLVAQGIENMVEESAGAGSAWAVWIENDDLLDRARAELDQFRRNPDDSRYAAATQAREIRKHTEKAEQRRRDQFIDVRTRWARPSSLARPVTILLAVCSIIASLAGTRLGLVKDAPKTKLENVLLIAPVQEVGDGWIQWDELDAVKHGQVWRLVTPIFLHYSPLHLVFNMFWLFELGSLIEQRRGSLVLLTLVIGSAICSNIAEYYLNIPSDLFKQSPMFGGMSGVNYALFGYAWIKGRNQPHLGIGVTQQTVTIMLVWLVLCMTTLLGPVANVAHLVGLICGVGFAYASYGVSRLRGRRSR